MTTCTPDLEQLLQLGGGAPVVAAAVVDPRDPLVEWVSLDHLHEHVPSAPTVGAGVVDGRDRGVVEADGRIRPHASAHGRTCFPVPA